jgi:hypothetical protein
VPDFSAELTNLHPFFMLLGEAAATFVSLLFIAVTWNPHILGSQTDPSFLNVAVNAPRFAFHHRNFAGDTIAS